MPLTIYQCENCAECQFNPLPRCPNCRSRNFKPRTYHGTIIMLEIFDLSDLDIDLSKMTIVDKKKKKKKK